MQCLRKKPSASSEHEKYWTNRQKLISVQIKLISSPVPSRWIVAVSARSVEHQILGKLRFEVIRLHELPIQRKSFRNSKMTIHNRKSSWFVSEFWISADENCFACKVIICSNFCSFLICEKHYHLQLTWRSQTWAFFSAQFVSTFSGKRRNKLWSQETEKKFHSRVLNETLSRNFGLCIRCCFCRASARTFPLKSFSFEKFFFWSFHPLIRLKSLRFFMMHSKRLRMHDNDFHFASTETNKIL